MKILAYVLSALGLVCMISASLIKGEKMTKTLFLVFCGNLLCATSYLIGDGINGAAACYVGTVQTLINYFFDSKNKPLPVWLIALYALAYVAVNIWVSNGISPIGILVIVASLTFIMCIGQKSGARYRFWTIVNMILWCVYDFIAPAYQGLVTHIPLLLFTVVGMIIHDRKTQA